MSRAIVLHKEEEGKNVGAAKTKTIETRPSRKTMRPLCIKVFFINEYF